MKKFSCLLFILCLIFPAFAFKSIDECVILNSSGSVQEVYSFVCDSEELNEIQVSEAEFASFLELKKDCFLIKLKEKFSEIILENNEKFQNLFDENIEIINLLEFKFITYENTSAFSISIDFSKKAIWNILCFDEQSESFSSYSDIKPVYEIHRLDYMKFSKLKQDNYENLISTGEYIKNFVFETFCANFNLINVGGSELNENILENFISEANLTYTISVPYHRYHSNADEIKQVGSMWCHIWNVNDFGEKDILIWTTHANNGIWYVFALVGIFAFVAIWFFITKKHGNNDKNDKNETQKINLVNF